MNLFGLTGPEFLTVYLVLLGCCIVAGILLRQYFYRSATHNYDAQTDSLDPYEVAFLAGGNKLAVNAALTSLLHQNQISLDTVNKKVAIAGPISSGASPLEQQLYDHIARNAPAISVRDLLKSSRFETASLDATGSMQEKLEARGLLLSGGQAAAARWIPLLLMLSLLAVGGARILQGLSNNQPTGYLIALWIFALIITLVGFGRKLSRSSHGDALLQAMKAQQAALQVNCQANPGGLQTSDLVLAMGLFGMGVMTTGIYNDLRQSIAPHGASGGGCGSGCGSGSSCGGGGGGCGGGGCGGCGGGGD